MININNVSKKFIKNEGKKSREFYAVKNISFTAESGEIFGVLGQNGAGKTTLLRMISGIMEPNEGKIKIDNKDYLKNSEELKNNLAFLSGNTKLYPNITPKELLTIFGRIYGIPKKKLKDRIEEVSNLLELKEFENSRIGNLSTGQTQRVNLARCFIHDPSYYILDESTSGLDVMSSQIIIDFIKEEKKKGKTIIYSTHYMEEAENICDRVIIIDHGIKLVEDTPKKLMKDTKTNNLRDAFMKTVGGINEN